MCWFRCTQSPISLSVFLRSIWGKETYIRSIHQESMRKPTMFAPAGWITSLVSVGSYIMRQLNGWHISFFLLLLYLLFTLPLLFLILPLSFPHLCTITIRQQSHCDTFIQGWVDMVYTLLSFGCSLDEFFVEHKIMKTIRSLNTKSTVTLAVPLQPISFHKRWFLSLLQ